MADDKELLDEDYLDSLLNSVDNTDAADEVPVEEDSDTDSENIDDNSIDDDMTDTEAIPVADDLSDTEDIPLTDDLSDIEDIPATDDLFDSGDIPDTDDLFDSEDTPDTDDLFDSEDIPDADDLFDSGDIPATDDISDTDEDLDKLLKELEMSENEVADADKIADELSDNPGVSEFADDNKVLNDIKDVTNSDDISQGKNISSQKEKKSSKEKKNFFSKLFGKKDKEVQSSEISPDDNDSIIKMHEQEDESDAFDLSEFDEFDSLDDIEDRSSGDTEKTAAEIKAEKEKKKKEKKDEKKKLKKEKAEQKKKEKAEKKRLKAEKPKPPAEKIKISPGAVILSLSVIVIAIIGLVFGGKTFWYRSHINDASELLIKKKYVEAYDMFTGIKAKKDDEGLYNQLRTLMLIQREYDSYNASIKMKRPVEGLSSLVKGVKRYEENKDKAELYGVEKDAKTIYSNICDRLSTVYGITPEQADELNGMKDNKEYTRRLKEIVKNSESTLNNEYDKQR